MAVKELADACVRPIIEALGYELVEVSYKKEYGTMTLTVYIDTDAEGGISLDDCEKVSNAIDGALEENDPTGGAAYNLNVSSPGLDRPLTLERDFRKNCGKEIELSFYQPVNGKKKICGVLQSWTDESVTVTVGSKADTFDKKAISIIKPVIKF